LTGAAHYLRDLTGAAVHVWNVRFSARVTPVVKRVEMRTRTMDGHFIPTKLSVTWRALAGNVSYTRPFFLTVKRPTVEWPATLPAGTLQWM
jgi:hypothetical protein